MTTTNAFDPRPVVALDIDGVLNPDQAQPGYTEHQVTIPAADVPRSPFVAGAGARELTLTVRVNADHATWIRDLRTRVDVVWATTWENAANRHYAPLLGIDPLEVGTAVAEHPPRFGHAKNRDSAGWKAEALEEKYPNRPLVWIDDSAWRYTHGDWYGRPDGSTLVLAPDPYIGLSDEHIAQVELFLAAYLVS